MIRRVPVPAVTAVPPTVSVVSGVVPPTSALKIVCAALVVSARAPSTVVANTTLPPALSVVAPASVTASLYVCVPVVPIVPDRLSVPAASVVRLRTLAMLPVSACAPEVLSVRSKPPPATPLAPKLAVVPVSTVPAPSVVSPA